MKNTIIVPLFLCFAISTAFAQPGDYARFVPAMPRVGDTLRIEYDAGAEEALLKGVGVMEAEIAPILGGQSPPDSPVKIPLSQSGLVWRGTVGIVPEKALAYICKFHSEEIEDRNQNRAWLCIVHDQSGRPVPHAHLLASFYYFAGAVNSFALGKNDEMRLRLLAEEARLHPGKNDAFLEWCKLKLLSEPNDVMRDFVRRAVDSCYSIRRVSGYSSDILLNFLEAFGKYREADTLRELNNQRFPAHSKAVIAAAPIGRSNDSSATPRILDRGIQVVPWTSERASRHQQNVYFDSLAALLPVDTVIYKMESAGYHFPGVYAALTMRVLYVEANPLKAQDVARHGIDMIRKTNPEGWLDAVPEDDAFFLDENIGLRTLIEFFIYALVASDRYSTALEFSRMVFTKTRGKSTHLNYLHSKLLLDSASFEEQRDMLRDAFERGSMNDSMLVLWRTILARNHRAETELLDTVRAIFTRKHDRLRMRLRASMIKEAPPPFILQSSHGSPLPSESFRGKTTVLMFWHDLATHAGFFSAVSDICGRAGQDPDVTFVSVYLYLNPPQPDEKSIDGGASTVPTTFLDKAQELLPCARATYSDGRVGGAFPYAMARQYVILDRHGFIRFKGGLYTNALQFAHEWLEMIRLVQEQP